MSDFQIVSGADAAVRPWQLIVSIAGCSGSGKTTSALRLGNGIRDVVGGDLGAIDTENGRMTRHLTEYRVNWYLELHAPFTGQRYLDAATQLVNKGCRTIIIDGLSAEHEGAGGHLEQHEANVTRMAGENADYKRRDAVKFAAWISPKAERNKLIQGLLRLPVNFVWCFRAKEKIALEKNAQGKVEPKSIGWQPIAGEELVFEATALCVLPPRSNGVPDWSALAAKIEGHHRSAFPDGQPITEETGRAMARFASEGVAKPETSEPGKRPAYDEAEPYALGGRSVLTDYWKGLSKAGKAGFKPHADALGKVADDADRERLAKSAEAS